MVRIHIHLIMPAALLAAALGALPATAQITLAPAGGREGAGAQTARDADFVGSPQPLPAVPRGARLPAPCRGGRGRSILATEQALALQSDGRGWARNTVNRLCIDLLGRVSEPCSRDGVKESYLTPDGTPGHRSADRTGSGRRHLRLDPRRWRRSQAIRLRLRRTGQFPGALRPAHGRHRRRLVRPRRAAADHYRDRGARYLHRRPRRQYRVGRRQSGPPGRAVGRGILFPLLSRNGVHAILPPEPRRL